LASDGEGQVKDRGWRVAAAGGGRYAKTNVSILLIA
jgi:hypothetical protein